MSSQIKISFQEDGRKQERIFEFAPHVTCRHAVEQVSLEETEKTLSLFVLRMNE